MRPMILSAIATAAAASAAPAGCCVLGGDGSGVIVGGGPLATARGAAPALTSLALGASPAAGFVAVLAGFAQTDAPPAGPEAARAGWIITRGAGGAQTLTAWAPAAGGGAGAPPVCTRDTAQWATGSARLWRTAAPGTRLPATCWGCTTGSAAGVCGVRSGVTTSASPTARARSGRPPA